MNLPPKSILVTTGDQPTVTQTIDDFFLETFEFVKENYEVPEELPEGYWQIRSGELAYDSLGPITNDRVTYLSYQDMILASVFETRTVHNHVRYTFFRNLNGLEELVPRK